MENLFNDLQSAKLAMLFLGSLLKSIIVLGLAGVVCRLWRGTSAATRHLIRFLAVVSLPLLPFSNLLQLNWQKPVWAISTTAGIGNQTSLAVEFAPPTITPPVAGTPKTPPVPSSAHPSPERQKLAAHFDAHWMLAGWCLWLCGLTVIGLRNIAGQLGHRSLSRQASHLREKQWSQLLDECCNALRLKHPVALLQSSEEVMPVTWGWRRPVILLPKSADDWPQALRRVVLLHELAHVKRRDYLTQIVVQCVCGLYWFNPLVWLAARQMRMERESACDDLVLTGGCKASEYASHLVEIARNFRTIPQVAAIAMARPSHLEGRIMAIIDSSRNRRLRSAAAATLLAVIAAIAVCLGGCGTTVAMHSGQLDSLRAKQVEQLEKFSRQKKKQSQMLAAAAGETISPQFQRFFDAATRGDWQMVTNLDEGFKEHHPQYSHAHAYPDLSLRTSFWNPVLEICLAYEQVIRGEPAYTQMAVDDILDSIPAGSIYFGGTDPGRGLPTAFCKSQVNADPFYTLTQNALADGSYLEYLDKTYGHEKQLLGPLAKACSEDSTLKSINARWAAAEKGLKSVPMDDTNAQWKAAYDEAQKSWEQRDERVKTLLADVEVNAGEQTSTADGVLYIPTRDDAQRCFQDYVQDAVKRLKQNQLDPGEDVKVSDNGRIQVSGRTAVMHINGLLAKVIFDKNPGHEFFIEESFPLGWMYPYLEPHGLIMKINREPIPELSDAIVQQDQDFWQPRVKQMLGGWLTEATPVAKVTAFGDEVFRQHDLDGFTGDPRFVQNDDACRMFSKFREAIAGIYAWRAEHDTDSSAKERMARAADFAFRQALALCPYSPEAAERYSTFLKSQHRDADATAVDAMAKRFQDDSAKATVTEKGSVLQMRLAYNEPTDNTEPMLLATSTGASKAFETLYVDKGVLLDQSAVQSASFGRNRLGYPEIDLTFTEAGARQFAEITRQHLHQHLAVVIDHKLWMAPVVQAEITGGKAVVTGAFSNGEAKALVAKITDAIHE